jgi:hypothetical protein
MKLMIILSVLFLIVSNDLLLKAINGQSFSDGSGDTNIAIAQGGNAAVSVNNTAHISNISISIETDSRSHSKSNNRRRHGYRG